MNANDGGGSTEGRPGELKRSVGPPGWTRQADELHSPVDPLLALFRLLVPAWGPGFRAVFVSL